VNLPPQTDDHDELDDLIADLNEDPTTRAAMEDAAELYRLLDALRAIRKTQHLKQKDIAAAMGTTQSAVSKIEGGASDPQITTLMRYARAVGVRIPLRPCLPGGRTGDAAQWVTRPAPTAMPRQPRLRHLAAVGDGYLPKSA